MEKIDYESYMARLGDFETNQQKVIQKYLEEQCKADECLRTLYRPEKIGDCYSFIKECAKKRATGNAAVIDESIVYKMARDYFIEILPQLAEKQEEEKTVDVSEANISEVSEDMDADIDADTEPAGEKLEITSVSEEASEVPCNQGEVGEVQEEGIRYDEAGNALLFDFM